MTDQPSTPGAVAEALPPLTPWQQQIADAILRGEPITLSIPRGHGRATIARHVEAAHPAPEPKSEVVPTGAEACGEGCCMVIRSREHRPSPWWAEAGGVYVRPMFQVLYDVAGPELDDEDGMHVPASEYDRPDRVFL